MRKLFVYVLLCILFAGCQQPATTNNSTNGNAPAPQSQRPIYTAINTQYRILANKDSIKHIDKYFAGSQMDILLAINRIDAAHITQLDTVLVPGDMSGNILQYSPYPQQLQFLQQVNKIIFFSYPAEYFAAYEHGSLVRSGPTNMGREKDPTPTGLFYTNWKAEDTKSTFNDEWDLKWNFNIQNKEGVGFHEYALPGYPASHSCLRLLEADAKYLYDWADQWIIKGTDDIKAYGTPVVVFGTYPFGSARPWRQLAGNPHALDITESALQQQTGSYINDIMAKQQQRAALPDAK